MKKVRFLLALVLLAAAFAPAFAAELVIHYHRPDGDFNGWTLWTWDKDRDVAREIQPSERSAVGVVFRVDLGAYGATPPVRLGILPKYRHWIRKDDPNRLWTPALGREVYLVTEDRELHAIRPDLSPRVVNAFVDAPDRVRLVLSQSVATADVEAAKVEIRDAAGRRLPVAAAVATSLTPVVGGRAVAVGASSRIVVATLGEAAFDAGRFTGTASFAGYRPTNLRPGRVVDHLFDGRPLGALVRGERIFFRTFAPTASAVEVLVYDTPRGGEPRVFAMRPRGNGIWQADAPATLVNRFYTLRATVPEGTFEVIDPYSQSNTAHNGRGMIVDCRIRVTPAPPLLPSDAIIYQIHVRDFTIDPAGGVVHRGKYLGLTETGTRLAGHPEVKTGLDHIRELGVNTIHIMPLQDFDNNEASEDYNWGFMPYHFFSPDGWYATRRDDATRVREVKAMTDALHRAGLRVVLDVVNNHTAEVNSEVRVSFNGLAPDFYYRVKEDGSYWNGSACGNEFRSEVPMGRKFVVDSIKHWMREYGMGGFRFDLMGLIDLETMREVVAAARAIDPHAFIYGEPWAAGPSPIRITVKGDQRGENFGVFNDHFRDAMRGPVFGTEPGWLVTGRNGRKVRQGIMGSITDFAYAPWESVNYIEKHDNHTLQDRLELTTRDRAGLTRADLIRMNRLGGAVILTSQGVPFIHSGQELLRTKGGSGNSYNEPDSVNMIRWDWKRENREHFEYYRGLIALRNAHPMFRLGDRAAVRRSLFFLDDDLDLAVPGNGIGYILHGAANGDAWQNALLLFNPDPEPATFAVPPSRWIPVVDDRRAGVAPLGAAITAASITVPPRSAMVFYNEDPGFHARVLEPRLAARVARRRTFTVAAPDARRVTIAGTFNGWNMDQHQLTRGADGTWSIELELERGDHEYKFLADGDWDALNRENRALRVP